MAIRADAHIDEFHRDQQWHKPCRVATTANITISTALNNGDTIDGVTLATGDRVLVKDQSTGSQNGIYIVGASPERAYDWLSGNQALGAFVPVVDGTANGGTVWRATVLSLPTIGSTSVVFTEFPGSSGGSLDVSDGSTTVSPTSLLSFDPADFAVTDLGSGEALVEFTGSTGGGSDPTIPAGGTLYDGTSTSGWTTFGSPDTFDANSTVPGALYIQKNSAGGNNLTGALRSCSSFPRTYTMKLLDAYSHKNFHSACIVFAETGPGKFWSFGGVRETGSPFMYFQRYSWNSATSSNANVNYGPTSTDGTFYRPSSWLRIVINSSSDVELWQSHSGLLWYRFVAAANPGFTIASFGFGFSAFASIPMAMAVDWIHES